MNFGVIVAWYTISGPSNNYNGHVIHPVALGSALLPEAR